MKAKAIRNALILSGNLITIYLAEYENENWAFLLVFFYLLTWGFLIYERSASRLKDTLIVIGVHVLWYAIAFVALVFLQWLRHDGVILALIAFVTFFSVLAMLKYLKIRDLAWLTVIFVLSFVAFFFLKIPDSYFGYLFALLFAGTLVIGGRANMIEESNKN